MIKIARTLNIQAKTCLVGAFGLSTETPKWKPKLSVWGRGLCRTQPRNGSLNFTLSGVYAVVRTLDVEPKTRPPGRASCRQGADLQALDGRFTQRLQGLMVWRLLY